MIQWLDAEKSRLTADRDAVNDSRIAELKSLMSKVQCNAQNNNAKLDMLISSALARQQGRKDDTLVHASDSQPVRRSGDDLVRESGHNLTKNSFYPNVKLR